MVSEKIAAWQSAQPSVSRYAPEDSNEPYRWSIRHVHKHTKLAMMALFTPHDLSKCEIKCQ